MKSPRHILPAALVTCAAALAVPSLASATDFCVDAPGCAGTQVPAAQFADALKTAQSNGTDDRFLVGAGTIKGPLAYNSLEKVEIIGAGRTDTVLRTSGDGVPLSLTGSTESVVSDLTVDAAGTSNVGLVLAAARAENVTVKAAASNSSLSALVLMSGDARFARGTVEYEGAAAGIETTGSGGTITGSTIAVPNGAGVAGAAGETSVRSSVVRAENGVIGAAGHTAVSDTLIDTRATSRGVGAFASTNTTLSDDTPSLDLDRDTIVAAGRALDDGAGIGSAADGPGKTSTVHLRDSIITGFDAPIIRSGGGGVADVSTDRSVYLSGTPSDSGPGKLTETNRIQVNPRFVDPAAGDFRLASDSPLIDAGATDLPDDVLDAGGKARRSDGNGDCTRVADIGAFEFQGTSVTAAAHAAVASATAGQAVEFSSDGSCIPGPGAPKVSWSFDDGTTADGATVSHAFAAAGKHTATATVADADGHQASASTAIDVTPVPVAAPPARKAAKPRISGLRVKGSAVRFKLSRKAKVDISFAKVGKHGKVKRLKAHVQVAGKKGANRVRVHLKAGRYRVTAVATAADGGKSKPAKARFKVARKARV